MPNKARLDKEAREIVWRVSEYFRKQLNSNTADYVEKTVSACGVSRATVYRIRKEKEEPGSSKSRNKKPVTVYDEERYLIRKALYEFQQEEGCPPTLEQLRLRLQSSMEFDGDERVLRKMLRRQGFFLKKIEQPIGQQSQEVAQDRLAPKEEESQSTSQEVRKPEKTQVSLPQKLLVNATSSANKSEIKLTTNHSLLGRKSLASQKTLIGSALGEKTLLNNKPQMYQIVGVSKGGQVILKPQAQVRLVQKATTILKVNQPRLQG